MPAQDGFRLKDTDNIPGLICSLLGGLFEFYSQNGQSQFFDSARFDGVFRFALQDGELLAEQQNFEVFFPVG